MGALGIALDRRLSLSVLVPPELASAPRGDVGFVMLDGDTARLREALAECGVEDGDGAGGAADGCNLPSYGPYEQLERRGVLVVSPWCEAATGVTLAGGSYSSVTLDMRDGTPVVCKRLTVGRTEDLDREIRQRCESAWLRQLPDDAAALFAPVIETVEDGPELVTVTAFVPGYTLAERVFQRRVDGAALAAQLIDVYEAVRERLWRRAPIDLPGQAVEETYLERIVRRIERIDASSYPADGVVRRLLRAETVIINGRRCQGVFPLLRALRAELRWDAVVHPRGRTLCHGDLILEDVIVSSRAPLGFVLVDPNPANQHPVFDVCKTMMSLWLCYEPIYFDRFTIAVRGAGSGTIELSLSLDDEDVRRVYAAAAELFLEYVERELSDVLQLPSSDWRSLLRMGAVMNMLAITVFHLLHHRKEERALAFVASALWHAQVAVDG